MTNETPANRNHLNILVIRNDKIGDFMLAWPALSILKQQYPDCKITALVPAYTRPLAELCPWIDATLTDNRQKSFLKDIRILGYNIKNMHFDVAVSLYSELRTAIAIWIAGIPVRIAPASKLFQILHNKRLLQHRSRSEKPEYEYNSDLVRYFITLQGDIPASSPPPPFLIFPEREIKELRSNYAQENQIKENHYIVIIHPGTGGSAVNLNLDQYAELARLLHENIFMHFVITAGPGESDRANTLSRLLNNIPHTAFHSNTGLANFARFINICDLFISGSTGPLHIAGALNLRTAAFYPARRSATALRWQTLNEEHKRISFMPDKYENEEDLSRIDIQACVNAIIEKFFPTRKSETRDTVPNHDRNTRT